MACTYFIDAINMTTLAEFIEGLPPYIQKEVMDFAEFLLEKRAKEEHKVRSFDREVALKDLREQYTSVELPHETSTRQWDDSRFPIK
jgi:hypothetical protein